MNFKWQRTCYFALVVSCNFVLSSHAAEYSGVEIFPTVTSIVYTRTEIGLTLEPTSEKGILPEWEQYERYFVARRTDLKFGQTTSDEFAKLLESDHYRRQLGTFQGARDTRGEQGIEVMRSARECMASGLPTRFVFDGMTVPVKLNCDSKVSDVHRSPDALWIGTYRSSGHGAFASEGLVIASHTGDVMARISVGPYAATSLAIDPWTDDVWILAQDRVAIVSQDHVLSAQFWPIHVFDSVSERPNISVVASTEQQLNNPLAVIAYSLGEKHYEAFYRSINNVSLDYDPALLGDWFMRQRNDGYQPKLPIELSELVERAEATYAWRKFVCMLDDERGKRLCALDLSDWPCPEGSEVE